MGHRSCRSFLGFGPPRYPRSLSAMAPGSGTPLRRKLETDAAAVGVGSDAGTPNLCAARRIVNSPKAGSALAPSNSPCLLTHRIQEHHLVHGSPSVVRHVQNLKAAPHDGKQA